MPSLKDLRNRIDSVKSTKKITQAMKMVAASKLKKAQTLAEKSRSYSGGVEDIVKKIVLSGTYLEHPLIAKDEKKDIKKSLVLVVSSDRGLCGGFNSNICKLAKKHFKNILEKGKQLKILTVGSKGHDQIKTEYGEYIIFKKSFKEKKQISFKEANEIGRKVIELYEQEQFDKCFIFYNNFKNVITQIPQAEQIIPTFIKKKDNVAGKENAFSYEFEPDEDEILDDLLPKNVSVQIFKAFLENAASEQGSRMTAMDNATRNAGDLVDKLTINYNRSRQASITKELIEIISGAESL